MKKIKLIITAVLIVIVSVATYVYFKMQPVENVPERAILVLNQYPIIGNEGENNAGIKV